MSGRNKKKKTETINQKLALVFKSGKATLGYRSAKKAIRRGDAKLILISDNCPHIRKSEIEYLCMLADVSMHHFVGNNSELGTPALTKFFILMFNRYSLW